MDTNTKPEPKKPAATKPAVKPKAKAPAKKKATKKAAVAVVETKPKVDRRVGKKTQQARKYDVAEMFQYYCEDVTRSYQDVAEKFGSTKKYISNLAAKEETTWVERRRKVVEKLQDKVDKQRYQDAKKRDDSHLKSFRQAIQANTNTIIREGNKADKGDIKALTSSTMALYRAIMGERIILGLPVLIARSEVLTDEDDTPTLHEAQISAERMAERAREIEELRNNG